MLRGLLNKYLLVLLVLFAPNVFASNYLFLFDAREFKCLVKNIYYESRGQSSLGQEAVALVTLNRVASRKYPNSVCKVVYARKQFSWTASKKLSVKNREAWERAERIAYRALIGNTSLGNFKATHFHAVSVRPGWSKSKHKLVKIGDHIFYR